MGTKKKASDKLYFSKKTKLPFTHFSSPSILKVETQVTHWNKLTENNTLPPSNLLQKFSLKKKKILLQKLHLIQISNVTRTKPEHIISKKKNYNLNIFKKEIDMGFKYLWISAPELFKAEQLFVANNRRGLEMGALARRGSWSGVPWSHPHFVLEFSLFCVSNVIRRPVCFGLKKCHDTWYDMRH